MANKRRGVFYKDIGKTELVPMEHPLATDIVLRDAKGREFLVAFPMDGGVRIRARVLEENPLGHKPMTMELEPDCASAWIVLR